MGGEALHYKRWIDEYVYDGVTDGYSQRFCAIFASSTFSSFTLFLMDFFSSRSSSSRRTESITITHFISKTQANTMNNTQRQAKLHIHPNTQQVPELTQSIKQTNGLQRWEHIRRALNFSPLLSITCGGKIVPFYLKHNREENTE